MFAVSSIPPFLYAIPLILAFSFCYTSTRHEQMRHIVPHALLWVAGLVAAGVVFFGLIYLATGQ